MKVGDLVEKISGYDAGTVGIVTDISTNAAGNTLVHVLADGIMKVYGYSGLRVIDNFVNLL